jgi:hypothetical protein
MATSNCKTKEVKRAITSVLSTFFKSDVNGRNITITKATNTKGRKFRTDKKVLFKKKMRRKKSPATIVSIWV